MVSRTLKQYEALGMDGPWVGPFTFEHRAPRDTNSTGNYYASRGEFADNILGIAVHITAGLQDFSGPDNSAESTDAWGRNTSTASWPGIVDSDSIINSLHPKRVAFLHGVPGYNFNRPLFGLEISKLTADWRGMPQPWVDATLKNVAAYLAPVVIRYNIPLRVLTNRNEIQRLINAKQKVGFTEHWNLTPETRQDAGRVGNGTTFPWERFFMFLRARMAVLTGSAPIVIPPTPKSVVKGTVLEVTAEVLNTRSGPGTEHPVAGNAPKGTRVVATGKVSGPWVEAQTEWQQNNDIRTWWNTAWLKVMSQPKPPAPSPKDDFTKAELDKAESMLDDLGYEGKDVWAKTLAFQIDLNMKDKDGLPGPTTQKALESEMSKMDQVLAELKAIRTEQAKNNRFETAKAVWAYAVEGHGPFNAWWWLRRGAVLNPKHSKFPADPGSPADMERQVAEKVLDKKIPPYTGS